MSSAEDRLGPAHDHGGKREHPDQSSIDAWRAAAEAKDHAGIRARMAEEAYARKHSKPTRILGVLVVGGVLIHFIGEMSELGMDLGGPLFLLAGGAILAGKQAGLRFVALVASVVTLAKILSLGWSLFLGQPVAVGRAWHSFDALPFWTVSVATIVHLLAEAILAFVVLRHRQLRFWTKAVTVSAVVIGLLVLTFSTLRVWRDMENRRLCQQFDAEVRAVERYLPVSVTSIARFEQEMQSFPAVHSITISPRPNSSTSMRVGNSSEPRSRLRKATRYLRLPSGGWVQLELELIVPNSIQGR